MTRDSAATPTRPDRQGGRGRPAAPAGHDAPESRVEYREPFDFVTEGYLITDARGIVREVNWTAAALLGCVRGLMIDKPLAFLFSPSSRAMIYRRLAQLSLGVDDQSGWEASPARSRASVPHVFLTVAPLPAVGGAPPLLRWRVRDVSQTREAESARYGEQLLANSLLDAAEVLFLVVDADGKVLRSNSYLQAVSGYEADELLGRDWCELLLPPPEHVAGRQLVREAAAAGAGRCDDLTLVARDGRRYAVAWTGRVFDADGRPVVALLGRDETASREARLQATRAQRLAAVGQTAAALAHEGRNALQRAQSCVTLLGFRLQDRPEALEILGRLQAAQDDLQRLFEDVRSFASPILLERQLYRLCDVWREARADLGLPCEDGPLDLPADWTGLDPWCSVDAFRLKQVFRNLLENALTAGAGAVTVRVHCSAASLAGHPALRVAIRDDGPGLTAEQRARAFEPFFTTKPGGTGLGLAICRRIVEAHGGEIAFGTEWAAGTEVCITLPRS